MPQTPDRDAGVSDEEATIYEPTVASTVQGEVRYDGAAFSMYDASGAFNPRTGGSGITASQHKALRDLIHFLEEGPADGFTSGAFMEQLPSADPFPTSAIWYTSAAKTDKIVEQTITYNANKTINTDTWKMYDTDGSTVLVTLVDTYAYTGVFIDSITRTWS